MLQLHKLTLRDIVQSFMGSVTKGATILSDAKAPAAPSNFIRQVIDADNASGKHGGKVVTRFPPEPNGYLHIGHAKSICLNFGLANDYGGVCHLRFDDTNPVKEDVEYEESIKEMVEWLGFSFEKNLYYASDYFATLYAFAQHFIERGLAYVDSQSADEIRAHRGTLTEPGTNSPFRDRSVSENLRLFDEMKRGLHADGSQILRLKLDMASPNINLRDPAIYRIRHTEHHRTGNAWCVYPMYDYTHAISDAIERITHSLCTLEFEAHRPLYDWVLAELVNAGKLPSPSPQQIEFSRLNLSYTVMSKRKLLELVETGLVNGWDDPRMMTLAGLRRRGFTPGAIRLFAERVGVSKAHQWIDMADLERALRDNLDATAMRAMAVLDPVHVVIENYPKDTFEACSAKVNPHDDAAGERHFKFARDVFIERQDFMENPVKGFFRLVPGGEVRLRHGFIIKCERIEKDAAGNVTTIFATYDPATKSGSGGRNVKGAIHWVAKVDGIQAEVRLYDRLFNIENPDSGEGDYRDYLNPKSLQMVTAWVEPSLANAKADASYQFERNGYFTADRIDSKPGALVFNRAVTLKDGWKPG